jgi:hypothetical protein
MSTHVRSYFFANNINVPQPQNFINRPNGPMARRLTTINKIGIKRFQVRPLVRSNSSQSSYLFFFRARIRRWENFLGLGGGDGGGYGEYRRVHPTVIVEHQSR